MKNYLLVALIAMFLLAGCVAGPNSNEDVVNAAGKVAGFWPGKIGKIEGKGCCISINPGKNTVN